MNLDDERDHLWDLLGKAEVPAPSAFFARNILREIRQHEAQGFRGWFARGWRLAALSAGGLAALLAVTGAVYTFNASRVPVPAVELARQTADKSDYEVIARLDELLASENNSIWFDLPAE